MLPNRYNRDLVYLVSTIYKRVGPIGLLGIPFCTLAMEKTAYDTYTAYHGRSIYADAAKRNEPPPQFPSGGAQLPSFSPPHWSCSEPKIHARCSAGSTTALP